MTTARNALPQLNGDLFLTDGGIETTLIFHEGLELPEFAAFDLLKSADGRRALDTYFRTYASIAQIYGLGFVLEAPTWRASPDWGAKLGYSRQELADANRVAIEMLEELRDELSGGAPMVISGNLGPRGDGYVAGAMMSPEEARRYHAFQIDRFSDLGVDLVTALTMTYSNEAIGITRAAQAAGVPAVISFTTETDGRLPSGESLGEAIRRVDAETDGGPAYYMINCAHTSHFEDALHAGEEWRDRIRGLRTNASSMSHAQLDEAAELDDGNPVDFGDQHRHLVDAFPHLNVIGGCCGTDHRHIGEVVRAVVGEDEEVASAV
jgi:S-methylmethionine-dependent homocysteine/selenocysteine methylase